MNIYEKLGILLHGLATKETHVTLGRETSLVEGEVYVIKASYIYNQGKAVAHHKETFSERALENMADPQVVADAVLTKLKTDSRPITTRK